MLGVLSRASRENIDGWDKIGLLVNFDRESSSLHMYSAITRNDQHYVNWIPTEDDNELITAALHWLKALMDAGFDYWTAMFLGLNSNKHFVWIPNYDVDYGPWKVDTKGDNWPTIEKILEEV